MENGQQTLRLPHLGKRTPTGTHAINTPPANKDAPAPLASPIRSAADSGKTYSSEELFGNRRDLSIMHRGERYSLRITSLERLILTK